MIRRLVFVCHWAALLLTLTFVAPAAAERSPYVTEKVPVAVGRGGAVSTVDPEATGSVSTSCVAAATRSMLQ